eukprot:TRINITY_DN16088_c0_g1_i2.p1 TRINITY_DN16088_c0_g1~~TRINITY_DN16088_c0_g1_i2.p1  ORF type:complete len:490 (+),score=134.86 TRINITY_DN16088_c0_g1_i2:808-2277(+)
MLFRESSVKCADEELCLLPPTAFTMALAEVGLFSRDPYTTMRISPPSGEYCRTLTQHLQKRHFRIRWAEEDDVDELLRLEQVAAPRHLRITDRSVLLNRIRQSPTGNFVVEALSGGLLAVLFTTRTSLEEGLHREPEPATTTSAPGPIVKLLGINADPAEPGLGSALRDFALRLAQVDPSVQAVVGMSRCRDWRRSPENTLDEYVAKHKRGELRDPILGFHTSRGAEIAALIPNARPQDTHNAATTALICYKLRGRTCPSFEKFRVRRPAEAKVERVICEVLREFVGDAGGDVTQAFSELGMANEPSALEQITQRLRSDFGVRIPAAAVAAQRNSGSLAAFVTKLRMQGMAASKGGQNSEVKRPSIMDAAAAAAAGVLQRPPLDLPKVLRLQRELRRRLLQPDAQQMLSQLAQEHYPDEDTYIKTMHAYVSDQSSHLYRALGLAGSDEELRKQALKVTLENWEASSELRAAIQDVTELVRMQQSARGGR